MLAYRQQPFYSTLVLLSAAKVPVFLIIGQMLLSRLEYMVSSQQILSRPSNGIYRCSPQASSETNCTSFARRMLVNPSQLDYVHLPNISLQRLLTAI